MSKRILLFALIFTVLIGLPIAIYKRARQQDLRNDELEAKYECERPSTCVGDFDGDGVVDQVNVVEILNSPRRFLTVVSKDRELLRLPYVHIDGTLRTHTAVTMSDGQTRLLIYDGASYPDPVRAAFGWNGEKMVETSPSYLEREIISAMAAHDDSGGWNERVIRNLFLKGALFAYYVVLAIVIGAIAFRRQQKKRKRVAG